MKKDSDNFRLSAILDIIDMLIRKNKQIIIYEPQIKDKIYNNCKVVNDLEKFKEMSSIIVANRLENNLKDVMGKVYTRDIFSRD